MKKLYISGFSDEIAPDFDTQLQKIREWGLSHIELRAADGVNVSDFTPEKVKVVKEKLAHAGVSVSSIGSPIGKVGLGDDFPAHLEKLKRTLEIQKELSAPYLRMFSFYLPQEKDPAACREQVLDQMGRMIDETARWDSVLLHENEKGIYGNVASRCLDLMENLYGPHFKAVFDFANFVEEGQDTLEAYQVLRPYIEYIHVKDALKAEKRVVPAGQGDGHVKEILSDLIGGGWKGPLSMEPHLSDFAGLAALEHDPQKRGRQDGVAAWKLALDALRDILRDIPEAAEALA